MKQFQGRVSIGDIPSCPMFCFVDKPCVYRKDKICDDPRICKGNGDAACHRMNNKDLLPLLKTRLYERMTQPLNVCPICGQHESRDHRPGCAADIDPEEKT